MKTPRVASWILSRWLPIDDRDEIVGDLDEQFSERVARFGRSAATRWYWGQTMHLARRWKPSHHLTSFRNDVRYGLRLLRRSRGFALSSIFTLAVGIGATTSIYSVVYGVLLRPLPVRDERSLAVAYATSAGVSENDPVSYPTFQTWKSLDVLRCHARCNADTP